MNSVIFGEKENFSIEVKADIIPHKFYLRMWFNGCPIGKFRQSGSLDYIVNSYFKFQENREDLYEKRFSHMTDAEILYDILLILFTGLPSQVTEKMNERLTKYSFDFGDYQFNGFTFLILNLKSKNKLHFLIDEADSKSPSKVHSFEINGDYFILVYKQFMRYAYENNLKKHKPFFSFGFSYIDIQ